MNNRTANWAEWCHDRYTLEDIETALDRVEADITGSASRGGRGAVGRGTPGNVVPLPAATAGRQHNPQAAVSQWHWVPMLLPAEIDAMLQAIASDPAMRVLADSERAVWLPVLFGFAACEAAGASGARDAAQAWSKTCQKRYGTDADFYSDWDSFDPKHPGGITVGTLIHHAEAVGIDLEPWRERARARQNQKGSAQQIRRGAPLSQLPHVIDAASAPSYLNPRFFKAIQWGKGPSFGRFDGDGTVHRLKPQDLQVALAGNFVEVLQSKRPPKRVAADVWWKNSATKEVFDRVLYDPENKLRRVGENTLNLWTGFAVQPRRGTWKKMRHHIWRVICGRDRVVFKYFIRWGAFCVQCPGTNPEAIIVMRSDLEGVGKSTVGQWFLSLFGPHGLEVTNYKMVFGDFNERIKGKSFFLLEEPMFPGEHQAAAILKAMITGKTVQINPKGFPGYSIPNMMHVMLTTNAKWAIPAGAAARRFLMLDVQEKRDRAYFNELWKEADNGGIEAMLFDLLRVDLSNFNPREVPVTEALVEQQLRSADSISQWITDCVASEEIMPGRVYPTSGSLFGGAHAAGRRQQTGGFEADWSSKELWNAYAAWCFSNGIRRPDSIQALGKAFKKMGLTRSKSNNPAKWTIPAPAELQAACDRWSGIRQRP